jgi:predicted molibdopterin-dependent oxidoreductase YjgC
MCVVDTGGRTLAASCVRPCEQGMEVATDSDEVEAHRRMLTLLLLSEQPDRSRREESTGDDMLYDLARRYGIDDVPLPDGAEAAPRGEDMSSPVIAVDHQACILCDRCVRGCDEIQHNDVITRTGKGYDARIAFDLDSPMGESTCVSCGECVAVCPTGALTHKSLEGLALTDSAGGGQR